MISNVEIDGLLTKEYVVYLLGLGVVLLLMKWQSFGFVSDWSWWVVLSPFAGAVLWWAWADWSGYTKRKAMEREARRKTNRIQRQREALGQQRGASGRRR